MANVFEKAVAPIQVDADDLSKVQVALYIADEGSTVPGQMRARVTAQAGQDPITADVSLSDVFNESELATISDFADRLIEQAFLLHGFEKKEIPDPDPPPPDPAPEV